MDREKFVKDVATDVLKYLPRERRQAIKKEKPSMLHMTLGQGIRNKYIYCLDPIPKDADDLSIEIIKEILKELQDEPDKPLKDEATEKLEKAISNWYLPHIESTPNNVINALCRCVEDDSIIDLVVDKYIELSDDEEIDDYTGDFFASGNTIIAPAQLGKPGESGYCIVAITDVEIKSKIPAKAYFSCKLKDILSLPELWKDCEGVILFTINKRFMIPKNYCQDLIDKNRTTSILFIKNCVDEVYADGIVRAIECPEDELERNVCARTINNEKIGMDFYAHIPIFEGNDEDRVLLAKYYMRPLVTMEYSGLNTVLYPDFNVGEERFSLEERINIAMQAVSSWLEEEGNPAFNIMFNCTEEEYGIIEDMLERNSA